MQQDFDIIVIGAGIAGASVAAHLSQTHKVVVAEMESRPGYHTTGRSAATYEPNYGPASIRALTRAARTQFDALNALSPRETMFLMPPHQQQAFDILMKAQQGMREISMAEAKAKFPPLAEGYASRAVLDPGTADIDVDLVHQSFLRQTRANGGLIACDHQVTAIAREGKGFRVTAGPDEFRGAIIVNASGAWGDRVAELAGAKPVGLQPKRRSIAVIPPPQGIESADWPMVGDIGETWYCKPQSGRLLVSPADATPVEPHDAFADDMALAEGIARFQEATGIEVTRVEHTWGGLRSFAPDGNPVVGYDKKVEGLFWLIGQGGYGIQTSPALSRLAAAMVRKEAPPADIMAEGLVLAEIAPERFGG